GDGDGESRADVEDPAAVVAADGQPVRARSLDVQTVLDHQGAASQSDGLAREALIEDDRVAIACVTDCISEGSISFVERVEDGHRAGGGAGFDRRRVPQLAAVHRVGGGEVQLVVHGGQRRRIRAGASGIDVLHHYGANVRSIALPELSAVDAV